MNKGFQIAKIVILGIIILLLGGVLVSNLVRGTYSENGKAYFNDHIIEEEVTSVNIDWGAGNVEVFKSDNNKLRVAERSYGNSRERMEVKVENKELRVRSKNRWMFFFNLFKKPSKAEVYLPEKQYEKFKLDVTSGKYTVTDLKAKSMIVDSTSGTLDMNNVISEDFKLDITSGKAMVTGSSKNTTLDMTSGSIEYKTSTELERLNIDSTSGKVSVYLPKNSNFNITSDVTSGKIINEFENQETPLETQIRGNFNIDLTSGNVTLKKN